MNYNVYSWKSQIDESVGDVRIHSDGEMWLDVKVGSNVTLKLVKHHRGEEHSELQGLNFVGVYLIEDSGFSDLTAGIIGRLCRVWEP